MSSNTTMADSNLDEDMVYLAYHDVFTDRLAKLRKPSKVRNVVEKHKDHLHHKQLSDSMDSEKICRILGDLLAARLFESDSAASTTFPTLFSPKESANDRALVVKCVEDGFECRCGQGNGKNPDALLRWESSVLAILLCQMVLPQRVLRQLNSIASTENQGASESLLEP